MPKTCTAEFHEQTCCYLQVPDRCDQAHLMKFDMCACEAKGRPTCSRIRLTASGMSACNSLLYSVYISRLLNGQNFTCQHRSKFILPGQAVVLDQRCNSPNGALFAPNAASASSVRPSITLGCRLLRERDRTSYTWSHRVCRLRFDRLAGIEGNQGLNAVLTLHCAPCARST